MVKKTLYIIVPCYNEYDTLQITSGVFLNTIKDLIKKKKITDKSRVLFVDDGSIDNTFAYIKKIAKKDKYISAISLSKNSGHQAALIAGIAYSVDKCDISITIDCDLQDDIGKVNDMVDRSYKGNDIVYGVRADRASDTLFKKFSAQWFYRMQSFFGINIIYNHADYRLMSKRAMKALLSYGESNLYLRGIVPSLGFNSTSVYYDRQKRMAGTSKYPISKMLALATNGITSFSIYPLRLITVIGVIIAIISFIGVIWSIAMAMIGKTVVGWASMTSIICFVSGIQLLSLGVIGEYIGKIYIETKHRPKYFIKETI